MLSCSRLISILVLCATISITAYAQEDGDGGAAAQPIYIPLEPAFVVNYGGVGRLKYLKAELTVRVESGDAAAAVRHHMPFIRNNIVLLFSKQTDEELETQVGKEALRQAALEEIRNILLTESAQEGVVDLYFENFIVQR
ncbi:hypothetical protein NBRC116494_31250 [Aurantivibrio plasticivorans]